MSRESVLGRGRAAAEKGMTDTCLIRREIGSATNPSTGVATPTYAQIYPASGASGPCRLQELFGFSRETNPSPDQQQLARSRTLQLPVEDSENVRVGDLITIVLCVNDPDMTGAVMVVREQSGKSEATVRRVGVEEITG